MDVCVFVRVCNLILREPREHGEHFRVLDIPHLQQFNIWVCSTLICTFKQTNIFKKEEIN